MKKINHKKIKLAGITVAIALVFVGCGELDVVGNVAKTSFSEIVELIPEQVSQDETSQNWVLTAPDSTAAFYWSKDYSLTTNYDAYLEFDAEPFIAAGLDTSKLAEGILVGDKIVLGVDFGSDVNEYTGDITPATSFDQIVDLYRDSIGYHETLDHYGVDLGNGNKFEWAKDAATNEKDIVFVVNPEPFIAAGVDPEQVEGWTFTTVEMKDSQGKTIEVEKFLKFFNLD